MLKLLLRYSNYLNTGDIDPSVIPETERIITSRRRGDYSQTLPTNLDWSLTGNNILLRHYYFIILFALHEILYIVGSVTDVIDQGPCNSCAAHSASSALESCLAIARGMKFKDL